MHMLCFILKINMDEIKNKVYSMYTNEELNNADIDSISIYTYVDANYGNVLSVSIRKFISHWLENVQYSVLFCFVFSI